MIKNKLKAPNFKLLSTGDKEIELNKLKSKYIVLYFYPKDDTPGCTLETKDFNKLLTILIPTKNRFYFIKRQLTFYYKVGFSGFIFIGDSSNQRVSDQVQELCDSYSNKLKTKYFYCPNFDEANTTRKMVNSIKTPYGVWVGDDDFLIPEGLRKCITFLEKNNIFIEKAVFGRLICDLFIYYFLRYLNLFLFELLID